MARLILAILAGWLAAAVPAVLVDHVMHLTGVYPPYGEPMYDAGLLFLAFTYRAIFAVAGAYLTSLLSKERAKTGVWVMGILGTLAWAAGGIAMWDKGAAWYPIVGAVTSIPLALAGWKLQMRKAEPRMNTKSYQ